MKKIVLTAAIALAAVSAANAQSATANMTASLSLVEIITLTPSTQTGTGTINTFPEYTNGIDLVENPQVTPGPGPGAGEFEFEVGASNGYKVYVKANSANFTGSAGGDNDMPCGAIKVDMRSGPFGVLGSTITDVNTLSTSNQEVLRHANGHAPAIFTADIHANPGYGYNGGSYTLGMTWTATLD